MLVKIAITAVVAAAAFAMTLRQVNKTAQRLENENAARPVEDQATIEELNDLLLGEFIQEVKESKVTQFVALVYADVTKKMNLIYSYRIQAALVIIALSTFNIAAIPAAAKGAAVGIVVQDIALSAFTNLYQVCA